jgi:Erv1 / Alr family
MNNYLYLTQQDQCRPQTMARTSNTMFIPPNVKPYYASETSLVSTKTTSVPASSKWSSNPKEWGPHLWFYLHTAAANYPLKPSNEQKKGMKDWLCSLKYTIPCGNCSQHYGAYIQNHLDEMDTICSSRDQLFAFLVGIHNKVNKRSGKPEISVEQARKLYL